MIRQVVLIMVLMLLAAGCSLQPATPTPLPTSSAPLNTTELKYRLLTAFPDFFFCDPDYYPIQREDETVLAEQNFPSLQANTEEFETILAHNGLAGAKGDFTQEEKLMVYREHKKLAAIQLEAIAKGFHFQIQVAQTEGEGELVSGQISERGEISVEQRTASFATCPICLAEGTLIDTPGGAVSVQDLRPGMLVWTMDAHGERITELVLATGKTFVPANHRVVHLILDDGRELWVSAGHPTADGRRIGKLQAGEVLEGSTIRTAELIPYAGTATYDLLPAGETGFYWANGIRIGSTLKH